MNFGIFSGIHGSLDYFGHVIASKAAIISTATTVCDPGNEQYTRNIQTIYNIANWIWINSIWRMGQVMHNTWNATNQLWCQFSEYLFISCCLYSFDVKYQYYYWCSSTFDFGRLHIDILIIICDSFGGDSDFVAHLLVFLCSFLNNHTWTDT